MPLKILRTISSVRNTVAEARAAGSKVALVPTMGGLHEGHLSLVEKAAQIADHVVVSLFVNPTQFNNPDDLKTYPGNETDDLVALGNTEANTVFIPDIDEMYPKGFATSISVNAGTEILCDAHRPGHFDGVATVVTKLFNQVGADYACFGEKDYQQLFIIRSLVRDLNTPIEIVPVETVREKDDLALSSRNARLTSDERAVAPGLITQMRAAAQKIRNNVPANDACREASVQLEADGNFRVEYIEYRSADTLELIDTYEDDGRLFGAAWLGNVRLIDNIAV